MSFPHHFTLHSLGQGERSVPCRFALSQTDTVDPLALRDSQGRYRLENMREQHTRGEICPLRAQY
jgi:hypothetical protein